MTLSSSHYLTVNVPYAHLLPENMPQFDVCTLSDPTIIDSGTTSGDCGGQVTVPPLPIHRAGNGRFKHRKVR
jgi:hypothetical protein